MFYTGCAIWGYKDWVGDLFPARQQERGLPVALQPQADDCRREPTFYAIPKAEVVARWAAETPEEFRFCFKLPRDQPRRPSESSD